MSTTIERRNGEYYLTDNGVESTISAITNDGKSLILPENSSGRKFFALSKFERAEKHDLIGINRDPNPERKVSRNNLIDYMTPEDKELYNEIINRARKAYEEDRKREIMDKIARLQAQLEAALADESEEV